MRLPLHRRSRACAVLGILVILMALWAPATAPVTIDAAAVMASAPGTDLDSPDAIVVAVVVAPPAPLFSLSFPQRQASSSPAPELPPPVPPPEA